MKLWANPIAGLRHPPVILPAIPQEPNKAIVIIKVLIVGSFVISASLLPWQRIVYVNTKVAINSVRKPDRGDIPSDKVSLNMLST